ncbi:MAG: galactose-1-phosphate uridylyltransferase [Firmicutes bacterium]|nr:galactose-1-phosphate uridylyltransferase [Bacillota bacterium]HPT84101.1 galactose-1-phosphate uridylyltransferase [Limnochordia bacterium]
MSELRWNPQLRQWVIVAAHRQDRTYKPPADFCPLCPTLPGAFPTEVPAEDYDIVVFENKFPSLTQPAPPVGIKGSELYRTAPAEGICEVVLYSPDHRTTLAREPVRRIGNLISVWIDRSRELGSKPNIRYVLVFENKGDAVGVTLHHPHGQIYAFPFIPPTIQTELDAAQEHHSSTGRCLYCQILEEEARDQVRIIAQNSGFCAFVPFFARYPFEVHLYPRRHVQYLADLSAAEQEALASLLKDVLVKYDELFGFPLPYMMVLHQAPSRGEYPYYHFHIEFYPLNRTESKLKYLASVESGAGTFITDMTPEDQAAKLRGEK